MFNDLIKELKEQKLETLAYADDLAIVGMGKPELKKAIKAIERWLERNRMKLNRKKSGIIFHTKQGPKPKEYRSDIEGIPVVEKYKYLGIWIERTMTMIQHLDYIVNKIQKGMKMLQIMR